MNKRDNYKKPQRNKSPRTKGSSSRNKDEDQFKREDVKADKRNDASWYLASPLMAKDVASLNFNNPVGVPYNLDLNSGSYGEFVAPGVMNLYAAIGPGMSVGGASGVDTAMKGLFAKLRSENSGAKNYDAADMMMYILAVGNCYAYYGWLSRLYGFARLYIQSNKYFGDNMIRACGVDPTAIIGDMAHFRSYINQFALRLGVFWVPASMTIFKRWMWMFSNVYTDEDTTKAQFYMYQPAYFHEYNEVSGGPGELDCVPCCLAANGDVVTTPISLSIIEGMGNNLIDRLQKSKDILTMSGDILKAFGRENCFALTLIPEDYTVLPVFSEEVLTQVHNTVFCGNKPLQDGTSSAVGWKSFNVTQDVTINGGALIWSPIVKNGYSLNCSKVLDFWKADVQPEDVLVATRNMAFGLWAYDSTNSIYKTRITTCGTELIMCGSIFQLTSNGTAQWTTIGDSDDEIVISGTIAAARAEIERRTKVKYFNEHPIMYNVYYGSAGATPVLDARFSYGELSNYTVVNFDTIRSMHDVAVMSMYDVMSMANVVRA